MLWRKKNLAYNMEAREKTIGAAIVLLGTFIWSFHPILIQRVTQSAPGLVVAVLTHAVALIMALFFFLAKGDFSGFSKNHSRPK